MSERVIIKPGSIILWFKPTLWQRLFGRKKEYEYNRASITLREMTEEEFLYSQNALRQYIIASPRQVYSETEITMLRRMSGGLLTDTDIINYIRPNTFEKNKTTKDVIGNKYYKVVLLGDKRNRAVTTK